MGHFYNLQIWLNLKESKFCEEKLMGMVAG
jgi:hypothetical protein